MTTTFDLPEAPQLGKRLAVRVTPDALRHVRAGHPWVFDGAITSVSHDGAPGDLAVIFDADRNFAAVGLWDPSSPIRIKILHAGKPTAVDAEFFARRIQAARDVRARLIVDGRTDALRLIHGENDGLPGLIVDQYGSVAVVKLYSAAWWPHLESVLEVLLAAGDIDRIALRLSRQAKADLDGGLVDGAFVFGDDPSPVVTFTENGLRFEADVIKGQKTGHFLDQRANRQLLREQASGAEVLDVFSHTGGFSVHAAAGGATMVHSVDRSEPAMVTARRHMEINSNAPGVAECKHVTTVGDSFEVLDTMISRRERFDIVVIDPPSFASRQAEVHGAMRAYRKLTELGLTLLRPGGLLVQASCSARVDGEEFVDTVFGGARSADVEFASVEVTGHAVDHPIGFTEGAYLKAVFARTER